MINKDCEFFIELKYKIVNFPTCILSKSKRSMGQIYKCDGCSQYSQREDLDEK